ncbi:hypothetical protein FPF71_08560 [Algibacter amylolyticus]|uniref:Uncharacterized protein n=1 Tax=Algibacter amylolyticus TaxID=1608400 RepID=A0A5M7BC36_9FLAO|nr:DUF5995 family protein [Algibacter amylolyticus]KAA5824725.1 hypothetical protein F2B50_08560 [Algibacter amylolyticus]MBB5268838.1 hypothetical protein [Algibacter amylolyticus]TSJ75890.1 hypothetical protein FPF71_08560 [Algibacter amylolyticus]
MPRATTIQSVLTQLDDIINECVKTNSRLGLFAYIYRRTTTEIASEIALGRFEDNARLEILDVEFANLYLDAYNAYKTNQTISDAWKFAFINAQEPLTIVQHIMLGMNAHINLDLALATAKTMTGLELNDIQKDFNNVNDILFQIVNELQDRLSRVSPLMILLDWVGQNEDEKLIDFSMRKAREQSWNSANLLWSLGNEHNANTKKNIDTLVVKLSEIIKTPKTRLVQFLLKLIAKFETKDVGRIISKLKAD